MTNLSIFLGIIIFSLSKFRIASLFAQVNGHILVLTYGQPSTVPHEKIIA